MTFSHCFDEKCAVTLVFGQDFIPIQGDHLGGIDGVTEGDFQVRHGWPDDQRIGNRGGGFDRFVVGAVAGEMAVTLEGADQVHS